MLDLLDKDFKEAVIKLLQQAIENMLETNKKSRNIQNRNRKSQKEIEDIKKNLIENLELKIY